MNYNYIADNVSKGIKFVAVTKKRSIDQILELYIQGHRDFGENRVKELLEKKDELPDDIRWHFIGHIQRKKVKKIVDFIYMIHSVDSFRLLDEIENRKGLVGMRTDKELDSFAGRPNSVDASSRLRCLLQVKIAQEDSKYGFNIDEVYDFFKSEKYKDYKNIKFSGLMGMATFTDDTEQIKKEFRELKNLFDEVRAMTSLESFIEVSAGMSGDYKIAAEEGSTMVRIGSALFE